MEVKVKGFAVVNQEVTETQQGVIKNNTVVLNYSFRKDETPMYIGFSIIRGKEGDANFTGQSAISGSLGKSGDFNTQMHDKRKRGDGALIDEVWEICDTILNPVTNEVDTSK